MNVLLENSLVLSLLVFIIPMVTISSLFLIKKQISLKVTMYLYAFASGMLLILATFGILRESYVELTAKIGENSLYLVGIIGGGVLLGLMFSVLLKTLIFHKITKKNKSCHDGTTFKCCVVGVDSLLKYSGKLSSIFLISCHKIIDGLSLGILVANSETLLGWTNIGILILFLIHDIPLIIIAFFLQRERQVKKSKIFLFVTITQAFAIPFIFVGSFLSIQIASNNNIAIILPFIEAVIGGMILFSTIFDLIPEFVHNNHLCNKHWYITSFWLSFGLVSAIVLSLIHIH